MSFVATRQSSYKKTPTALHIELAALHLADAEALQVEDDSRSIGRTIGQRLNAEQFLAIRLA